MGFLPCLSKYIALFFFLQTLNKSVHNVWCWKGFNEPPILNVYPGIVFFFTYFKSHRKKSGWSISTSWHVFAVLCRAKGGQALLFLTIPAQPSSICSPKWGWNKTKRPPRLFSLGAESWFIKPKPLTKTAPVNTYNFLHRNIPAAALLFFFFSNVTQKSLTFSLALKSK